ncbi:hypothetical protein BJF85_15845 [Saccharomonospora sp. CUA-673]|nr:hypothetical protein BJF85_15845 [Saccharomonospora sp. CUA-673]
MNDDVHNVLVEHYRLDDVGAVSCPGNRPVEVESTFACYVEVAGEQRKVTITVTGEDGSYEVGALQ